MESVMRAAAAILLALAVAVPASANIVRDGSFELNDGTWELSEGWFLGDAGRGAHSGVNSLSTGCFGPEFSCFATQVLPTTIGQRYDLTFWLYADGVIGPGGFPIFQFDNGIQVMFGDALATAIYNFPTTNTSTDITTGGPSTQIIVRNLMATSASTILQLSGYHDPSGIFFDDVSVELAASQIPEPGTLSLIGMALGCLGLCRRRRARML
ncbi:PEP-CTERM sorting domain-containing protein [Massilia sp. CFBP9012]|uniref:PEP-CTERM sorting domain-containing protein n=1 Tax=Massilia sp. CFBP9012 TaxID=3096531 RepID=UPI002A6ABE48|nr:PEP-CTERM sorting domain-containing protein [Massilia sp. CFBP9012]MDY0978106.1 PEP-CTERM sorting domain-containing protein [Massilia sp. CFBP9012]